MPLHSTAGAGRARLRRRRPRTSRHHSAHARLRVNPASREHREASSAIGRGAVRVGGSSTPPSSAGSLPATGCRSAFAERYRAIVGLPPLDYLARWRVHSASRILRATDRTVGSLATEFGSSSESAFSRTLKRVTGQSPTEYRKSRAISTSAQFPAAT
ncbi:helix-turn-helix domain-containing protein [Rugosimonospora acidiphila]|uniref:helix-turn-helix domain-containing protein n=1 Tax=Rugosimonospora acidiphila TaxID=556531 RepID=UPI0031EF0358